ncbi:MAG: putative toxin-antitoxin system toxin component, PIN family, partial [Actinomycetota bacterium]
MRVVLDTSILISALVFPGGPPERLLRLCLEGRIQLVSSNPLMDELARVLQRFDWTPEAVLGALTTVAIT